MGSSTVTLGTVNLSSFCGDGCPDCAPCCGINACTCTGIPQTLHLSWNVSGGCAGGFNGLTTTLTYNSGTQKWSGTQVGCGESYSVAVHCDSLTNKFQIDISGGIQCTISVSASPGTTVSCSPFDVTFGPFQITANAGCCCSSTDFSALLTLTA